MTREGDLQMTAELCRQEGVLGDSLQGRYGVVRDGKEVWVKRDDLTLEERKIIIAELRQQGEKA